MTPSWTGPQTGCRWSGGDAAEVGRGWPTLALILTPTLPSQVEQRHAAEAGVSLGLSASRANELLGTLAGWPTLTLSPCPNPSPNPNPNPNTNPSSNSSPSPSPTPSPSPSPNPNPNPHQILPNGLTVEQDAEFRGAQLEGDWFYAHGSKQVSPQPLALTPRPDPDPSH